MEKLSIDLLCGSGEQEQHINGLLHGFSGDLDRLWITTEEPLPAETAVRFRIHVGAVLLAAGKATVASTDACGQTLLAAVPIHPDSVGDRVIRLVPFLIESEREPFQAGCRQNLSSRDSWRAWAESAIRLSRLVEVSGEINSSRGLEELLGAIMESAKLIMESEASSLMLLDRASGELVVEIPTGPAGEEISGFRIPPGKGFGGWVARTGAPLIVTDAEKDPRFYGDIARTGFQTRSLICVPLRNSEGQIIGVLQALNRKGGLAFTEDDISIFSALSDHAAIAIEKAWLHKEALEKQRLEREISLAKAIQAGFFPKAMPALPGFEVAGLSEPAAQVGGDYYDAIPLDPHGLAVVVADISGKGFSAALLMASLRAALRAQVNNRLSVGETIALVNSAFVDDSPPNRFVTLFYGELDGPSASFQYVNAGHNPPFLLRGSASELLALEEGGPIVGFMKGLPFTPGTIRLELGDSVVMYTDGVVEAQNRDGEMFGDDRLKSVLLHHGTSGAAELLAAIHQEVLGFVDGAPQYDDLTLLVFKRVS